MVSKKVFDNPRWVDLCRQTYDEIIKDNIITEDEWLFLEDLHEALFGEKIEDRNRILEDIKEIGYTKVKIK